MNHVDAIVLAQCPAGACFPLKENIPPFLLSIETESLIVHTIRKLMHVGTHLPIHITVSKEHMKILDNHLRSFILFDDPSYQPYILHSIVCAEVDEVAAVLGLRPFITRDFMVIKPLMQLNGVDLNKMFDFFVFHNAAVMTLARPQDHTSIVGSKQDQKSELVLPGMNVHQINGTHNDGIVNHSLVLGFEGTDEILHDLESISNRVVCWQRTCEEEEALHLALLMTCPNLMISRSLEALPCVLFTYSMLQNITEGKERMDFTSLIGEVLPYLVGLQQKSMIEMRLLHEDALESTECGSQQWWHMNNTMNTPISDNVNRNPLNTLSQIPPRLFKAPFLSQEDSLRCFCFTLSKHDGQCTRVIQNLRDFVICIDAMRKIHLSQRNSHTALSTSQDGSCTIMNASRNIYESHIGKHFKMESIGTVKQCTVGNNVLIGEKCRIINSIIMDNVRIGDQCKVTNSVICDGSTIENYSTINDCIIGFQCTVNTGIYKNDCIEDYSKESTASF